MRDSVVPQALGEILKKIKMKVKTNVMCLKEKRRQILRRHSFVFFFVYYFFWGEGGGVKRGGKVAVR